MNIVFFELGIIAFLLILNAVFSMSEMAIVSARKVRLQKLADAGNLGARQALKLGESPSRFLLTIQIGITLVGILSGVFGGATLSEKLGSSLAENFNLSAELSAGIGVGIVVSVITFLSVVFGELIPKRIAMRFPEKLASWTAVPMNQLSNASRPVVWLFSSTTDFIFKILGLDKEHEEDAVTHDEIKAMVEQGEQEGLLESHERLMVDRILGIGQKRVTSIMTPERDIVWLDVRVPLGEQLEKVLRSHHTAYPVAEGGLDHLIGTIKSKDILQCVVEKTSVLKASVQQPLFIPETSSALQVLDRFQRSSQQIGFVIDEFGSILGLVTLKDITATIVGEMPHDGNSADAPVKQREDGSWLVDGAAPIETLKEHLGIDQLDGDDQNLFTTAAGFFLYKAGRVPAVADQIHWNGWNFEVVDMDKHRIDKILISKASPTR